MKDKDKKILEEIALHKVRSGRSYNIKDILEDKPIKEGVGIIKIIEKSDFEHDENINEIIKDLKTKDNFDDSLNLMLRNNSSRFNAEFDRILEKKIRDDIVNNKSISEIRESNRTNKTKKRFTTKTNAAGEKVNITNPDYVTEHGNFKKVRNKFTNITKKKKKRK